MLYEKRGKTCFMSTPLRCANTLRLLRSYAASTRSRSNYISFAFDAFLVDFDDKNDFANWELLLVWGVLFDITFADAKPSRANRLALPIPLSPTLLSMSKRDIEVVEDVVSPFLLLLTLARTFFLFFSVKTLFWCYNLRANVETALCSLGTRSNTGGAYTRYP